MAEFAIFRCCSRSPIDMSDRGAASPYAGLASAEQLAYDEYGGAPVPERRVSAERMRSTAIHEAGHAVVGFALRQAPFAVTIDGPPTTSFRWRKPFPAYPIVAMAGEAASSWARSEIARIDDAILAEWIAGIRALRGGACDRCKAIRFTMDVLDYGDRYTADLIRQLETITGCIVRHSQVWPAIVEMADALMRRGTIKTQAIRAICLRHFEPGLFDFMLPGDQDA